MFAHPEWSLNCGGVLLQQKLPFHVLLMRDKMGGSPPDTYFDTISQQLLCVNLVAVQFELGVNNGNSVLIAMLGVWGFF